MKQPDEPPTEVWAGAPRLVRARTLPRESWSIAGSASHLRATAICWVCLLLAVTLISLALESTVGAVPTSDGVAPETVARVPPSDNIFEQCDIGATIPADVLVAETMDELLYLQSSLCPND